MDLTRYLFDLRGEKIPPPATKFPDKTQIKNIFSDNLFKKRFFRLNIHDSNITIIYNSNNSFSDYLKTFGYVELDIVTVNLTIQFCYVIKCYVMIRGLTIEGEQTRKVFKKL